MCQGGSQAGYITEMLWKPQDKSQEMVTGIESYRDQLFDRQTVRV